MGWSSDRTHPGCWDEEIEHLRGYSKPRYDLLAASIMVTQKSSTAAIRNIYTGFISLCLILLLTFDSGFYPLIVLKQQQYYPFILLALWCLTTYLLFRDHFPKSVPIPPRIKRLNQFRNCTIPILVFLILFYSLLILFSSLHSYSHCDTLNVNNTTYHLDLSEGLDRNYLLLRCNKWQFCKRIAQSVDEDALYGEKLHVDNGFIIAIATNRSEPIIWSRHDAKGQFIERTDRVLINP
jgi:hypothetical protein